MSLVSLITYNNNPFIVSDLAFSNRADYFSEAVPSLNANHIDGTEEVVKPNLSFGRKSIIINEHLYIGLAGIVVDLQELLEDVKDYFCNTEISIDTFTKMLEAIKPEKYTNCSILFLLARPDISNSATSVFKYGRWLEGDCDDLQGFSISSAGTGQTDWNEQYIESERLGFTGSETIEKYIHKVLSACMKLLSFERRNLLFLNQGWGGGFDITYYFNGRFHNVDDVAYTFWVFKVESSLKLSLLSVIHNSYRGESLIIRNISHDSFKGYILRQMTDTTREYNGSEVLFSTKYLVSVIHVVTSDTQVEDLIVSHYADYSFIPVETFLKEDGRIGFNFSSDVMLGLNNALAEFNS